MQSTVTAATAEAMPTASRARRTARPLLLAGSVGLAALALHLRDPHQSGSWGYCPWALLTGLDCPGCGALRAVNDLTSGDLLGAASSNLLLVAAIPLALAVWVAWLQRSWDGVARPPRRSAHATKALWIGAILVIVVFTVLRNTPWGAWLHS